MPDLLSWRPARRSNKGLRQVPWFLLAPSLLLVLAIQFAAPAAGAFYAFTNWNGIGSAKWIGFQNFSQIFASSSTLTPFLNTLKLAASFVVLVNVFGLGLALALNRVLKTRFILRAIFFLPAVMSPLA